MAGPALVVRVAANLSELKQNLKEGESAIHTIGDASTRTSEKTKGLSATYREFDGVLRAAGINIGPQVGALDDLHKAASKGGDSLGLLSKAGLAVGAGVAAWGITRAAMEFLGLDKNVESAWRQLLQYGDVAAQTAGAQQDTINRAIANGAAETIKYSEAIEFNLKAFKRNADAKIDWAAKLSAVNKEVRGLTESQIREIEIAKEAGATTEQLTNKFGISAQALKVLAEQQKLAGQAAEEHRQKLEALDKSYAKLMSDIKNANQLALMEDEAAAMQQRIEQEQLFADLEIKARLARQEATNNQAAADAVAEQARIAANQAEIDGILAAGRAHADAGTVAKQATDQTIAGYAGIAQQVTITGDAVKEWLNLMRYTAEANAILQGGSSLFTTRSQRERVAALPTPRASGGPVSAGAPYMVGERGPELFVPERGGTIVPNGAAGSNVTIAPVLNFHGPVIGSSMEFEQTVAGALLNLLKSGAVPMPA